MEIKELIESGILERFVLGETDALESSMVMDMAAKHAEVQQEIDRIESTMHEMYARSSVAPPASVKQDFLKQIAAKEDIQKSKNQQAFSPQKMSVTQRRFSPWAVAASVAIILSTSLNVWLYQKWQHNEEAIASMQRDNQLLTKSLQEAEYLHRKMDSKMSMMENPDYKMVVMKGTGKHPGMIANVYWNKLNGTTYLDLKNLPPAPEGKQYQLWAIVDGKPLDAGVFDVDQFKDGMVKMKDHMAPEVFAVTIEKMGGSSEPTMDQMVMLGAFS